MCGILGRWNRDGRPVDTERWSRAVNLLEHRGPDDGACWAESGVFLGHRRLAILDLSPAGLQPMASIDGRFVITFNGEIYNFIELRQELRERGHRFQSTSDTEVILNGYAQWGAGVVERLSGMFAFAIFDRADGSLFLARDRFGEKPLLYLQDEEGVSFASEVSPLAALLAERAIDPLALGGYLCLNYVPGERTLLRGVRRLRPGTWQRYETSGSVVETRYFDPFDDGPTDPPVRTDADLLDELQHRLETSVRQALRSDVPVAVLLSGGVDSSLVAASATRIQAMPAAFCLVFEESSHSEWEAASGTARQLGIPITPVRLAPDALGEFVSLVSHGDDPLADSSALAVWTVARAVSSTHKVVLSGDGGDELFGGYLTYRATAGHSTYLARLPSGLRRRIALAAEALPTSEGKVSWSYKVMRLLRAAALPPTTAHLTWNGTWLPEQAASLVTPEHVEATRTALDEMLGVYSLSREPGLRELQGLDLSEYLPNDILTKVDRMSMAHGLEVRSPLLSPQLADFALGLPTRLKSTMVGPGKRLLRALAHSRYGLQSARGRKQGFSIPVHAWLRGPGLPLIRDLLSPESVEAVGCLQPSRVQTIVNDHLSRRRSLGWEIWGLLVLVAWHRLRIAGAPDLPTAPVRRRSPDEMRTGHAAA